MRVVLLLHLLLLVMVRLGRAWRAVGRLVVVGAAVVIVLELYLAVAVRQAIIERVVLTGIEQWIAIN